MSDDELCERLDALRYHTLVPVADTDVEWAACAASDRIEALKAELAGVRSTANQEILCWLGYYRDHLPPQAVTQMQDIAQTLKSKI